MAEEIVKKQWWKSRTLWVNVLVISGAILTAIFGQLEAGATLGFVGVVNIILRVVTTTPVKF
jgi:hypothetical protein